LGFCWPSPDPGTRAAIKHVDVLMAVTERRDLMVETGLRWAAEYEAAEPYAEPIVPRSPIVAESEFLRAFERYGGRRAAAAVAEGES